MRRMTVKTDIAGFIKNAKARERSFGEVDLTRILFFAYKE